MAGSTGTRAIIVGAGIGGLTAAIALRRAGIEAVVFERAGALRQIQVGGGIVLWSNAMRPMQQLGLAEPVRAIGAPVEQFEFRTSRGELLAHWPVGEISRKVGAPTLGMSRADLHPVLAGALDDGVLHLGAQCTDFSQDEAGVTVRFADGREERGDLLIGADGINSTVRAHQFGEAGVRYAGYTVWQGTTDFAHALAPAGLFRRLWGLGSWSVFFRVGGERLTWHCVANAPAGSRDAEDGPKAAVLRLVKGWQEPMEAIIDATEEAAISRMDIYGGPPVRRWGEGRITLLGDAAHPITLNVGQGAGLAIEDAAMLAKCLTAERDVVAALRAYEAQRGERTARMLKLAWRLGALAQWENPATCWMRDRMIKLSSRFAIGQQERDMAYQV